VRRAASWPGGCADLGVEQRRRARNGGAPHRRPAPAAPNLSKIDLAPAPKRVLELASTRPPAWAITTSAPSTCCSHGAPETRAIPWTCSRSWASPPANSRQTRRVLQENPVQSANRGPGGGYRRPKERPKTPLVDQLARPDRPGRGRQARPRHRPARWKSSAVIQILARRHQEQPGLIASPGVGKTAIVEGLAQRIIIRKPPSLAGKHVLQLDVGSLVAGTMYAGQFEERLKRVIEELKQAEAILFIDESTCWWAPGSAGSSVDAANILKPALSRASCRSLAPPRSTSSQAHRKRCRPSGAGFQPVTWTSPASKEIHRHPARVMSAYEEHHKLTITEEVHRRRRGPAWSARLTCPIVSCPKGHSDHD